MTHDRIIETVTGCRPLPPVTMWLGVLMADWCILAPCLLLFALMCAPFVGGSWDGDRFHVMAYPAIAVVVLSSILVLCGFRRVRWFYWIVIGLETVIAWINIRELSHWIIRWFAHMSNGDDCIGMVLAITGLLFCPLSCFMLASRQSRQYFFRLRTYRQTRKEQAHDD